ncbi:hypothetical protein [Pediococcus pentosaceus]|uniref:Uncharacterized protein n=1 Tax=Pediococcus pentosaceus TaxID=1255 RepID=A0ABQ6XIR5_PEDPE|nr:hypothetical protein [Pediococcus pentosaceus]KAF0414944.1 hypothetical protein GBO79_01080 [Pediococcus pentosaceus]
MDFADYILADTATKVKIVRKHLMSAGIFPSGGNIQLGLNVPNQFDEYTTDRKDEPINSIQVDNTELKETIELIEVLSTKVERANEAIEKLRDTFQVAPLTIDAKKFVEQARNIKY